MPKTAAVSAANTNWGLSFQENGKTPTGNATPEFLKQYGAYFVGPTASSGEAGEQKTIYLTFDAGFENGNTPAILDALKAHNAKACFFLVGNYLETSPELVKRMVEEGHTVGNHTYHHPDMSKIADEESFRQELTLLEDAYRELTGQEMTKFYRPPLGKNTANRTSKWRTTWGIIPFSGVSPTWTGTRQSSPPGSRRSTSCFPAIHPRGDRAVAQHLEPNAEILDELLSKWEASATPSAPWKNWCRPADRPPGFAGGGCINLIIYRLHQLQTDHTHQDNPAVLWS